MKREPWCIQRLGKPFESLTGFKEGIGIGGSNESRKLVKQFTSHDYMGSSEFEWGALPNAYEELGKAVATGYVTFRLKLFEKNVYGFCKIDDLGDVKKFIDSDAFGNARLKESTYFQYALGQGDKDFTTLGKNTFGWFDIDNLFMWFIDQEMFRRFVKFYGLTK